MKICYLANAQSIHTKRWINYFVQRGHNVHLISFKKGYGNYLGVKLYYLKLPTIQFGALPFKLFRTFFTLMNIRMLVRKINPDILHAHYISGVAFFGALSGFRPFVVSAWGSDILIDAKRSRLRRFIVRYVLKKADLITLDAKFLSQIIVRLGASPEKIKLVVHGVDLNKFNPNVRSEKLKNELKIPNDSPVIISLRGLEPIYDIGTLIAAMFHVLKQVPNAYLVVVGKGSLKEKLHATAEELGVINHVLFVEDVNHEKIPEYLAMAEIYVSTSLSDTTSVSLLEAMACGLPVVVTDIEGNREWVEDGMNGLLFPIGEPKLLSEKIVYLLRNQNIRRKFGITNRRIVERKGDYEKEMSKMEKLYRKIIGVR